MTRREVFRIQGGWGGGAQRNRVWNGYVRRNYYKRHWIGRNWRSSLTLAVAMAKNPQSRREGKTSLEVASGTTKYASLEGRWSAERLSGGEGIFRGLGRIGINLSYDRPGQGGGVLCWWWRRR